MKPSNNNNIVNSFICRNQEVLPMKFLDTLFQMRKNEFRFMGKIKLIRVKRNTFISDLKKYLISIFLSIRLNMFSFTPARTIII